MTESRCEFTATHWVAVSRCENVTKTCESILLRENVSNPRKLHLQLLRIRDQILENSRNISLWIHSETL